MPRIMNHHESLHFPVQHMRISLQFYLDLRKVEYIDLRFQNLLVYCKSMKNVDINFQLGLAL